MASRPKRRAVGNGSPAPRDEEEEEDEVEGEDEDDEDSDEGEDEEDEIINEVRRIRGPVWLTSGKKPFGSRSRVNVCAASSSSCPAPEGP